MKRSRRVMCFIMVLLMVLGVITMLGTRRVFAEGKIVNIEGTVRLSALVENGLTGDDTINVKRDATLILDRDYSVVKITIDGACTLTVEEDGAHTLYVRTGFVFGTHGDLTLNSGTVEVTGYIAENNQKGFYGNNLTINGGAFNVGFNASANTTGIEARSDVILNGGEINIDITASSGINSYGISAKSFEMTAGRLNCELGNTSGNVYGIYTRSSSEIVGKMTVSGGSAEITISQNGSSSYGWMYGIYTQQLNMTGGRIAAYVDTSKVIPVGIGVYQMDVSGGAIVTGVTASGENIKAFGITSIKKWNNMASAVWNISGGTVNVFASSAGPNKTTCARAIDTTYGENQVVDCTLNISGTAVVNANTSGVGYGVYSNNNIAVSGNASLNAKGCIYNGIHTNGSLTVTDKASLSSDGSQATTSDPENTASIFADGGIFLGGNQIITYPVGGSISTDRRSIVLSGRPAKLINVSYATAIDPSKVHVTNKDGLISYFSSSNLYWNNEEGMVSGNPDSPNWNARFDPDTGTLYLKNYDGGEVGTARSGLTGKKLTIDLEGENKINRLSQFGVYSDDNDLEIRSSRGGKLIISGQSSSNDGAAIAAHWSGPRTEDFVLSGNAELYIDTYSIGEVKGIDVGSKIIFKDRAKADVNVTFGLKEGVTSEATGLLVYDQLVINTTGSVNVSVKADDFDWSTFERALTIGLYTGGDDAFKIDNAEYVSFSVVGGTARDLTTYSIAEEIGTRLESGWYKGFTGFRKTTRDTDAIFLKSYDNYGGSFPITGAFFPDVTFRACVSDSHDLNEDGWLSNEEVSREAVLFADTTGVYNRIYSVAGVEYIGGIKGFSCSNAYLRTLDLSNNTNLTSVTAFSNMIDEADLTCLDKLASVEMGGNLLTTFDASAIPELNYLDLIGNSSLASIDLGNCYKLEFLDVSSCNALTGLDLYDCTELKYLTCEDCAGIESLDLHMSTALLSLSCNGSSITTLDLSNNPELIIIDCGGNDLATLDVSKCNNLHELKCHGNSLTSLKIGYQPKMYVLYCYGNNISTLDISNAPIIKDVYLNGTHEAGQYFEHYFTDDGDLKIDGTVDVINSLTVDLDFRRSISLNTEIALNAYIGRLPDGADLSEFTAKVFFNGTEISSTRFDEITKTVELTFDGIKSTYYYIEIKQLPAKQMTDEYAVRVYHNGTLIDEDLFSVRDYCQTSIASGRNVLLCRATLTYGAEAQKYFGYKIDDLADKNIESVPLTAISAGFAISGDPTLKGIKELKMSASLESQIFASLYFVPETGYGVSDFTYSVKMGDTTYTVTPQMSGSYIYIRLPSVVARNLGTNFDITVKNKATGISATWHRSVMNYCYNAQSSAKMTNLVRAMYQYYLAAK